jgi:RNA polymerase sigma-70 factor (ECF subfamily)
VEDQLPSVSPAVVSQMDWQSLMDAFGEVDEVYQASLSLFYLQELSYQEIAEVLQVPIGTVMSRIARGRAQLRAILTRRNIGPDPKIIPFPSNQKGGSRG